MPFMISPKVTGLPSLAALDKSISVRVNVSEASGCFGTVALMRGPVPQSVLAGALEAGEDCARDGNAAGEVSTCICDCNETFGRGLAGESFREGKGSGAPSSSCFFYICAFKLVFTIVTSEHRHMPGG